jgi:addiction module HigA family antidote
MSIERDDERAAAEYADVPKLPPVHPGEHLLEDFLEPLGITQSRLATDLGVPPRRVNEIIRGKRSITAETALLLARYFAGVSAQYWLNLQARYDLETARDGMREAIRRVRPLEQTAS